MLGNLPQPSVLRIYPLLLVLATTCATARGQGAALKQSTQAFFRGDYTKASELAKSHLRRFPNDAPVRVILARVELAQGEFPQAFEDLQKALASDPKNVDALYYLSLIARELSQRESQRLFSMAPASDFVHQLLGQAAVTADNKTQAEEEFKKALDVNPRSVEALTELAEVERSQFKFPEAITYYEKAAQLDPLNYEITYGLGICYTYTQEYSRAVEWLKKTVTLAPDFAEGRFALGKALFNNGQPAEAVSELKASVERKPRMKEAYALLGRVYSKLGRLEEAKAAVQKFAELDRAEAQADELKVLAAPEPKQ